MQKFVIASALLASAALVSGETINCVVTNTAASQVTAGTCTAAEAVDVVLEDGVSWTPAINVATITYTAGATAATCSDLATVDATLSGCLDGLAVVGEVSADQTTCITATEQGASKACGIEDGGACDEAIFCANFECNSESKCAEEPTPAEQVEYVWTEIPSTNADELKAKVDEVFPAETAEGNPCSGLGLTFTYGHVYPEQKKVYVSATPAIAADCLTALADLDVKLAAATAAESVCFDAAGCGIEACKCEKGDNCVVDAEGKSNCLDGLSCKTDGTDGATTGTCNSGVMASAAFAVAAVVLAVLF